MPNADRRQPSNTWCKGAAGSSCGAPLEARFGGAPRDTSTNVRVAPAGPIGRVVDARIAHRAPNGQTSSFLRNISCARHYLTLFSTRAFHPVCDLPIQNMAGMSGKRNFVCSMDSLTVGLLFVLKLIVRFDIEVVVSCSFGPSEPFNPADRVS